MVQLVIRGKVPGKTRAERAAIIRRRLRQAQKARRRGVVRVDFDKEAAAKAEAKAKEVEQKAAVVQQRVAPTVERPQAIITGVAEPGISPFAQFQQPTPDIFRGFDPSEVKPIRRGRVPRIVAEERAARAAFKEAFPEPGKIGRGIRAVERAVLPGFVGEEKKLQSELGREIMLGKERTQFQAEFFQTAREKQAKARLESEAQAAQERLLGTRAGLQEQVTGGVILVEPARKILEQQRQKEQVSLIKAGEELSKQFAEESKAFGEDVTGKETKRLEKRIELKTLGLSPQLGIDLFTLRKTKGEAVLKEITKSSMFLEKEISKPSRAKRLGKAARLDKRVANVEAFLKVGEGLQKPSKLFLDIGAGLFRRPATVGLTFGTVAGISFAAGIAAPAVVGAAQRGSKLAAVLLKGGKVAKYGLGGVFVGERTYAILTAKTEREAARRAGEGIAIFGAALAGATLGGKAAQKVLELRPARIDAQIVEKAISGREVQVRAKGKITRLSLIKGKPQEIIKFTRATTIKVEGVRTADIVEKGRVRFKLPSGKTIQRAITLRGEAIPSFLRDLGGGRIGKEFISLTGRVGRKQPVGLRFETFDKGQKIVGELFTQKGIKKFKSTLSHIRFESDKILKFTLVEEVTAPKFKLPVLGKKAQIAITPGARIREPLIPKIPTFGEVAVVPKGRIGVGARVGRISPKPLTFAQLTVITSPVSKTLVLPALLTGAKPVSLAIPQIKAISLAKQLAIPGIGGITAPGVGAITEPGIDTGVVTRGGGLGGIMPPIIPVIPPIGGLLGIGLPPIIGIPDLPRGGGVFGKPRRRKKKPKRRPKFQPSLVALEKKIFAKKKMRVISGLEVRPIISKLITGKGLL